MKLNLSDTRNEYGKKSLDITDVDPDPLIQFEKWMQEAMDGLVEEPTAMTLSTVSPEGRPASRVVLLKGIEHGKFLFYTNYTSRKGQHLALNQFVAASFFWPALERQVQVEGKAEKVPHEISDAYFDSRPRNSRIGAVASPQSQAIKSRQQIMDEFSKTAERYKDKKIPRPDHWGGFAITPDRIEFWQGGPGRLHDRVLFTLQKGNHWKIERLAP